MSKTESKKWFADMEESLKHREPTLKEVLYEQRVLSAMQTRSTSRSFRLLAAFVLVCTIGILYYL